MRISAREACVRPHFHTRSEIKYDIQQTVEIGLSSRDMCKVLFFGSYCSHHTRRAKFNFFPAPHNILLYFFRNLRYLIEVLEFFLNGI